MRNKYLCMTCPHGFRSSLADASYCCYSSIGCCYFGSPAKGCCNTPMVCQHCRGSGDLRKDDEMTDEIHNLIAELDMSREDVESIKEVENLYGRHSDEYLSFVADMQLAYEDNDEGEETENRGHRKHGHKKHRKHKHKHKHNKHHRKRTGAKQNIPPASSSGNTSSDSEKNSLFRPTSKVAPE